MNEYSNRIIVRRQLTSIARMTRLIFWYFARSFRILNNRPIWGRLCAVGKRGMSRIQGGSGRPSWHWMDSMVSRAIPPRGSWHHGLAIVSNNADPTDAHPSGGRHVQLARRAGNPGIPRGRHRARNGRARDDAGAVDEEPEESREREEWREP